MTTMTVLDAARIMHKDPQYIRKGLRTGRLPFGSALYVHPKRYSYHVCAGKFATYLGISLKDLEELLNDGAN